MLLCTILLVLFRSEIASGFVWQPLLWMATFYDQREVYCSHGNHHHIHSYCEIFWLDRFAETSNIINRFTGRCFKGAPISSTIRLMLQSCQPLWCLIYSIKNHWWHLRRMLQQHFSYSALSYITSNNKVAFLVVVPTQNSIYLTDLIFCIKRNHLWSDIGSHETYYFENIRFS